MAEYAKHHEEIRQLGFEIVAVSVDQIEDSAALKQSLNLPFTLLCDSNKQVVTSFGLLNRKERGGIAYPATFVLDPERHVRFRSLERTAARVDLAALLSFLRAGLTSPPPEGKPRRVIPSLHDWYMVVRNSIRSAMRSKKK